MAKGTAQYRELPKRVLVIDGMNIAYQNYYGNKLSYKGKSTSVIYGFMNTLKRLIQRLHPAYYVICWDGEKHPERLKELPNYKGHRSKEGKEDLYRQVIVTRKLLYYMGIPQYYDENIEGDDMIYMVTKKLLKIADLRVTIVSRDKDFNQLVGDRVETFNPVNERIIDKTFAPIHYSGLKYFQLLDYTMLLGDNSDDIPGYKGIGHVKAVQFLKLHLTIDNFLSKKKAQFNGIDRAKLVEWWKSTRLMMDLEYFYKKHLKGTKPKKYRGKTAIYKPDKAKIINDKYGLKTCNSETFIKIIRTPIESHLI